METGCELAATAYLSSWSLTCTHPSVFVIFQKDPEHKGIQSVLICRRARLWATGKYQALSGWRPQGEGLSEWKVGNAKSDQ